MSFMLIRPSTEIEVPDYKNLLAAWRSYGGLNTCVARFIVKKPLTEAQARRLPKALREKLSCSGDSIDRLEQLYRLEDPRD